MSVAILLLVHRVLKAFLLDMFLSGGGGMRMVGQDGAS